MLKKYIIFLLIVFSINIVIFYKNFNFALSSEISEDILKNDLLIDDKIIKDLKSKIKHEVFYSLNEKKTLNIQNVNISKNISKENEDLKMKNENKGAYNITNQSLDESENFKVEAIIKIKDKGCAIINSKIWYVGKSNFGYTLLNVYDEYVEIKTPTGKIIKCNLIKKKVDDEKNE